MYVDWLRAMKTKVKMLKGFGFGRFSCGIKDKAAHASADLKTKRIDGLELQCMGIII